MPESFRGATGDSPVKGCNLGADRRNRWIIPGIFSVSLIFAPFQAYANILELESEIFLRKLIRLM